jgi:cytochrome c oxidase subunit II
VKRVFSGTALKRLVPVLALTGMLLLASACDTDTPQNTFDTKGPVAEKQAEIFYISMWPALVIMILVLGGIVLLALRFRERDPSFIPKQTHGNTKLELAWTIAPAILLLAVGIPMVATIYDLGREPAEDALRIDVTGQRYSWSFSYPDYTDANGNPLTISSIQGPAHIPVDREVAFYLHSIDVIHSFWIPKLGGKLDVVPGQVNVLWLEASEAETFSGQCAEYCGLEHATMYMQLVAQPENEFDAWVQEALAD